MRTLNLLSSQAICEQLGKRIKSVRLGRNISQHELAAMTQGSLSSVRRLESIGQGSLDFVIRVAQALQVVDQFENLFSERPLTIVELERYDRSQIRQRARLPKSRVRL
jgi:transcriptional regulator with XRE-family HTH domain